MAGQFTRRLNKEEELDRKREELVATRAIPAERELELVDFRGHFASIEGLRRSCDPVNPVHTTVLRCGFLSLIVVAFVATGLNAQVSEPDLSGISPAARAMAEAACNGDRILNGPAAYDRCLYRQLQELRSISGMPDLSGLSPPAREMAEAACNGDRLLNGPAAYYRCLNGQLQELRGNSRIPDLSGLSPAAREMAQSVCNFKGPADYYRCLDEQLQKLRSSSGMPDLSGLSPAAREIAESECKDDGVLNGPAAYYRCLAIQLSSLKASGGQIASPPLNRSLGNASTPGIPEAPPTPGAPSIRPGPGDSGWGLRVAFLLIAGIIIIIIILYAKGRLRAGKCSKCGSPWLGIGVCPECTARAFGRAARGSEDDEAAHGARRAEEQREQAGYRRTEDEETKFRDGANGNQGDSELVDPFAVLGLRPGASKEEIRGAYLNLIGKYHPDKVAHLGIEFQEPAKTKTIQLIRAYDMLRDK